MFLLSRRKKIWVDVWGKPTAGAKSVRGAISGGNLFNSCQGKVIHSVGREKSVPTALTSGNEVLA